MIPYLPELRSVSFTAGHNALHGTEYISLCVLANAGPPAVNIVRATTTNRLMEISLIWNGG
jgi:hypothetical protein